MKQINLLFSMFIMLLVILSSCSNDENKTEYDRDENPMPNIDNMEEYYTNLKPIITKYGGDKLAISDVTLGGYYTGFERLGKDIIYCNDDNSVIWFDRKSNFSDGIMRLSPYNNKTERLCIFEECRNNINQTCNHMPGNLCSCYSDGILYTADFNINGSYILRYDIGLNIIEKLIVFDEYIIGDMSIYGKYMYVDVHSTEVGNNFNIVRIDLHEENAVIVYSGIGNGIPMNYVYFWDDRIIYDKFICDMEMQKFNIFFEPEANHSIIPGSLCMYKDYFYFLCAYTGYEYNNYNESDYNSRSLYRYNSRKMNEPELLLDGVYEFFINGDFLYYALYEPYEAYRYNTVAYDDDNDEFLSGNIVSETLNNGNKIYRVSLDYEYIDFYNKTEIYKPETGYYISEWKVQNDYIYVTLLIEGDLEYIKYFECLVSVKIPSTSPSKIFYKSENKWLLHSNKNIKDR